jgi:hypothetical protein
MALYSRIASDDLLASRCANAAPGRRLSGFYSLRMTRRHWQNEGTRGYRKSMAGMKEAMQVRKINPFVQYAEILTGV